MPRIWLPCAASSMSTAVSAVKCRRWRYDCRTIRGSATSPFVPMIYATTRNLPWRGPPPMTTTLTTPLTLESLRPRLVQLGLHGLLANAERMIHEPWLAGLLDLEEAERARRSLKRRLDDARLRAFKSVADFDWQWPTHCDRILIEELFSLNFIQEGANIVLIGPN